MDKKTFDPNSVSSTFCILPWIHVSTRPNGQMRVCCKANASAVGAVNNEGLSSGENLTNKEPGKPANLNQTDLLTGWNNMYMRSIRKQMLRGDIPSSCTPCFDEESAGHMSKRNKETAYWGDKVNMNSLLQNTQLDGSLPAKMYDIDLRLGNKCNLKCIMCSPQYSSPWESDWKELYSQIEAPQLRQTMMWDSPKQVENADSLWHVDNPIFWRQLYDQMPHMKQLYFSGGESTIIKEHYDLLEECIKRGHSKDIELRYTSNGIEMPERLFSLWKEFKRVHFQFSMDSYANMNDYIRFPSTWDHIENQLRRLDETDDNVEVTILCTVQMLNMYYIPDFIKWKLSQNYKKINPWPLSLGFMSFDFLHHPAHLCVKVFPPQIKDQISRKYDEFYQWLQDYYPHDKDFLNNENGIPLLKNMVNFMNSEDWSQRMPQFVEYINKMDTLRGTSFQITFPEMAGLIKVQWKVQ